MTWTVSLGDAGTSDADTNSYTTGTVSFTSGRLYVIGVEIGRTGAATENPAISGTTSGTWTNIGPVQFNTTSTPRSRVQAKYYVATSTFSEALTLSTTNNHNGCRWIVVELDGANTGATIPVQNATDNGNAGTSSTTSLAAFANSGNLALGFFGTDTGGTPFTAGGSFSLLAQRSGTSPAESLCCVYQVGDADPTVTFGSADYGGIGMELAVLTGGGGGFQAAWAKGSNIIL